MVEDASEVYSRPNLTSKYLITLITLAASISIAARPGYVGATVASFGNHVLSSSLAASKFLWLANVLYVSAQLSAAPDGKAGDSEGPGFDAEDWSLQHPPGPPCPQQPENDGSAARMAARERQKSPDLGSSWHCWHVPGPLTQEFVDDVPADLCRWL